MARLSATSIFLTATWPSGICGQILPSSAEGLGKELPVAFKLRFVSMFWRTLFLNLAQRCHKWPVVSTHLEKLGAAAHL